MSAGETEELREEIERTRHELGDTVEALVAKTDVKARAKEAAQRAGDRFRRRVREADGRTVVRRGSTAVAAAAGTAFVVVWARGRRR